MNNLVTQVLEPLIGNYFRNSSQESDVISFLTERSERQKESRMFIQNALKEYNVIAVDTLIGDIVPPEELMKTLTDKKIAEKQKATYETQKEAEVYRQDLEKAKANANTQASVVTAERSVTIAELNANAIIKKAEGDAKAKETISDADKNVLINLGIGEANKIKNIGESEAAVAALKVSSVGINNYAIINIMEQIATGHIDIVPKVQSGGGNGGFGESLMALMAAKMGILDFESKEDSNVKELVKEVRVLDDQPDEIK